MTITRLGMLLLLVFTAPSAEAKIFWRLCRTAAAIVGLGPSDAPPPLLARATSIEQGEELGSGGYGVAHLGTATIPGEPEPVPVILKKNNLSPFVPHAKHLEAEQALRDETAAYNKVHPGEAVIMDIEGDLVMVQRLYPASAKKKKRPALDATKFFTVHAERANDAAFKQKVSAATLDNLDRIHAQGLVHNDLKPANILISEEGGARIIDYGIAKPTGTRLDTGKGTLAYVSPRRFNGASEVSPRDDLHAMGMALCELEMGATIDKLPEYTVTRRFVAYTFLAWKRIPENDPGITAERALVHLTTAKTTTAEYRALLAASANKRTFPTTFAKQWLKTFQAETEPALKDHLIYELYLAPRLGPQIVKAIPDAKVREEILARGREMKDVPEADLIAWYGWHHEMKPQIEEFLRAFP